MKKVKCTNGCSTILTTGSVYEVLSEDEIYYYIGHKSNGWFKTRFEEVIEANLSKIKKIKCVINGDTDAARTRLVLGKIYDVVSETKQGYCIDDGVSDHAEWYRYRFEVVSDDDVEKPTLHEIQGEELVKSLTTAQRTMLVELMNVQCNCKNMQAINYGLRK